MSQSLQLLRTTTNNAPGVLDAGELSVVISPTQTKMYLGTGTLPNRLLLSTDPADAPLGGAAYLRLTGGVMAGNIDMAAGEINDLAPLPVMPNGAAPAQWVIDQIVATSLYRGIYNAATNVPDLNLPANQQNQYSWLAYDPSAGGTGTVIQAGIPGIGGLTAFSGDRIVYSTTQTQYALVKAGDLSQAEADALYVALAGSTMTGPLILSANAVNVLGAVPLQQMTAAIAAVPIADYLALAGGVMLGDIVLQGDATAALHPVTLQQLQAIPLTVTTDGSLTGAGTVGSPLSVLLIDCGQY